MTDRKGKTSASDSKTGMKNLWGSRFREAPSEHILGFTSARDVTGRPPVDLRLLPYDLWYSKAHTLMLARTGVMKKDRARKILLAIVRMESATQRGEFRLNAAAEDIHTNIDNFLQEQFGVTEVGDYHIGRSTVDETATDLLLMMRDYCLQYMLTLGGLIDVLCDSATLHLNTAFPGYMGSQYGMITTWAHYLTAFAEALQRDQARFRNWFELYDRSPAGTAEGFGTSVPIDRGYVAERLGFGGVQPNTLDTMTHLYEVELSLTHTITQTMTHLSNFAQTLRLFSLSGHRLIELPDEIASGSSLIPQRINPDPLEIIMAKAKLAAQLTALIADLGTGQLYGYSREHQWAKYAVIDALDETLHAASVMARIVEDLEVNEDASIEATAREFATSTDLVEALVRHHGLGLMQAKRAVEHAIKLSEAEGDAEIAAAHLNRGLAENGSKLRLADEDLTFLSEPLQLLQNRASAGGPAPEQVKAAIVALRRDAKSQSVWMRHTIGRLLTAKEQLDHEADRFTATKTKPSE
jgi:argininosuccinate lyase